MELCTSEKWQCGTSVEVFYDCTQRHLIFKKYNFLYSKSVDSSSSQPYVDLREYNGQFLSCSFSGQGSMLAFQRATSDIDFLCLDSNQHFVLNSKSKSILGYHWLSQTLYSDFVVIESTGIEFFKIFPKQGKIMSVRHYPLSVGHYWYNSSQGVLVAASSPPKLGQFSTFFINQVKGPKFFNGQRFNCDLSPSVTDKWTESSPHLSNLNGKVEPASYPNPHCAGLVYLYGETFFVHINCIHGSMSLYKLTHEKVSKVVEGVQVPPGSYGVREFDNLILLQNYTLQESYLVDIRSKKYAYSIFYSFWNGLCDKSEVTVSVKFEVVDGVVGVTSEVLFDGVDIQQTELSVSLLGSKAAAAECSFKLESSKVFVDNDICVDFKEGRCYKLAVYPSFITENHPDQVESILFLLRRGNCKSLALNYLKRILRSSVDLKLVSELFSIFASYYKIVAIEKKKSQIISQNPQRKQSINEETKISEGITLLLQSEVLGSIFFPLFEENILPSEKLASYVQAYIRSLWNEDLQVQLNFHLLLMKLLLKAEKFSEIEGLIQHHVLPDCLEISCLLISYSDCHEQFWHIAVDMLNRMKAVDKVVDLLLEKSLFFDAFQVMEVTSMMKVDIVKLLGKGVGDVDFNVIHMMRVLIKEWNFLNSR